jgi:sialate O-acetylesterase
MKTKLTLLAFILCQLVSAQSLRLNEMFGAGMVLQQKADVTIWGTSRPSVPVAVTIQNKTFGTEASKDGTWMMTLRGLEPGGPFVLTTVSAADTLRVNEVYVGEVWIAAGQSNMAWTLEKAVNGPEAVANAKNRDIRFLMVPFRAYDGDRNRGDMNWRTATTENVSQMSAVAYFFARGLQARLKVPVGIICCYKGGTPAEAWMSRETLLADKLHAPIVMEYEKFLRQTGVQKMVEINAAYDRKFRIYNDSVKSGFPNAVRPEEPMGDRNYKRPYGLYETMLKRIIPFSAKGVIWYQGEANAARAAQYRTLFPALIREWRTDFRNEAMPFLFVQLAGYDHPGYNGLPYWAELREAQSFTEQTVDHTAMVVTIDVGAKNTIHPLSKEPVGQRLAACAFQTVYGFDIPCSGPVLKEAKAAGSRMILTFGSLFGRLQVDGSVKGFAVCGSDGRYFDAMARIQGDKVEVWSREVKLPVAVRYGWANWTEANLKNAAGFPASPFRTDNRPLLTAGIYAPVYK